MKTYFIADTHFGDERIRRYENRPFSTVSEMDSEMIKRWNETITSDDTVYVLGDFTTAISTTVSARSAQAMRP